MILELSEGQEVASHYSLLHPIAGHESAAVWLAFDEESNERVCLKVFDGQAESLDACIAAIDSTRGLVHTNIARSFEAGIVDGNLFIASAYIQSAVPFNPDTTSFNNAWPLLEQLFSALEFAHGLDASHGRLHPGNLLTDGEGQLHITGFSLPAVISEAASEYISQEAQRGQAADASDDVYSLGCILFRLLTGRSWRQGETFEANSPIPFEVQQTVASMLKPSPYERPSDLRESKEILANYAQGVTGANSLEIPETTFRRVNASSGTQSSRAEVHLLPRERNQVSSRMVVAGLAVLLILAGFVFIVLPGSPLTANNSYEVQPVEADSPQVSSRQETVDSTPETLAPLESAHLEFLKEEGKRIASLLLRKQVELEDLGALLWGLDSYGNITRQADSGDTYYREGNYQGAIDAYESAIQQLQQLKSTVPLILEQNLATGAAAILEGQAEAAISAWTIASAIERDNKEFDTQLRRAENLQQVLKYMKSGEFHERELALGDALKSFRDAANLDPAWQPATKGVGRVRLKIAKAKFTDAMSEGFSALAAKRYANSKQAFTRAQKIFPDSSEPVDGILQIDLAERMDRINVHKDTATGFARQENWQQAIDEYNAVLEIDSTLVFAATGLEDAVERLEISAVLDRFLQHPTLMLNEDELSAAKSALVAASRIRPPGAKLKSQLSTLSRLISVARIPIAIELTSDNKTDITIYKIRNFGRIVSTEVELFPGNYTIVGKRRGYRDVQQQLTLLSGEPIAPLFISCVEKI